MPTINLGRIGFVNKGGYSSGTTYKVNDVVTYNNKVYACIQATTGNTPTNTSYWVNWIGDTPAGGVTFTPTGGIASTDVQSAIAELDTEKATKATTLAGYGITDATPSSHIGSGGSAHAAATTTVDGFMSYTDKSKLDGMAAATATPNMDSTASVGVSTKYAREDHTHPSDTSKQALNANLTSVAGLSTSTTGLMKLTNGTASLVTGSTGSGNVVYSAGATLTGGTTLNGGITADTSVINIGSGQVYKDTSGNVGIGTSSPYSDGLVPGLVIGNGTGNKGITLFGANNIQQNIAFTSVSGSQQGLLQYDQSTNAMRMFTNSAERMRIDSVGNVGIGVTPSAWYSVYKNMQIGLSSSIVGQSNDTKTFINNNAYYNSSSQWIYLANSSAAQYALSDAEHRWLTAPSGTVGNAITFTQAMTLNASGRLLLGTTTDDGVNKLQVNGSASVSGNVGIGTSSPTTKLYVTTNNPTRGIVSRIINGSTSSQTGAQIQFTQAAIADWAIGQPAGVNAFSIWANRDASSSDGTEVVRIDTSGNVGIGKSNPSVKLDVQASSNGDILKVTGTNGYFSMGTVADGSVYLNNLNAQPILFSLNGSEKMRIDSSGNVGIGVAPSAWGGITKSIDIGNTNQGQIALYGRTDGQNEGGIVLNAYRDSANTWRYKYSSNATLYSTAGGTHSWFTAPSGTAGSAITWTTAMSLDASGNLSTAFGNTNAMIGFNAVNDYFTPSGGSSTPQYGIARGSNGNNTLGISGYSGLAFYTSGTKQMTLDTAGNMTLSGNLPAATSSKIGGVKVSLSGSTLTITTT
jgi:hypothetical protein